MELKKRSLEFSQKDFSQELKSEVAQIKNMSKNNYSQNAFDGVVERICILQQNLYFVLDGKIFASLF